MKEKFLPIGTVVLLNDATKRIMITGYCSSVPEDANKLYDYVGCLFPEGNLAGDQVALFDHSQIGTIVYNGLEDDEFNKFNEEVKKIASGEEITSDNNEVGEQSTQPSVQQPIIDFVNMPPLTPENIGNIINAIKVSGAGNIVSEPTAFDLEKMKVPKFAVPTLDGRDPRAALKEKEEDISNEFSVEEYSQEVKAVEHDGTPVLQLQLIGGETAIPSVSLVSEETINPVFNLNPVDESTPAGDSSSLGKL